MSRTTTVLVLTAVVLSAAAAWPESKVDDTVAKAVSSIEKGKVDDALKNADKLAKDTANPEAQLGASRIFTRAGKLDEAILAARNAEAKSAASAAELRSQVLAQLASLELRVGGTLDALAHAEAAAKLGSAPETIATLVRARARVKDKAALTLADELVKRAPASATAHDSRGRALAGLRRFEEADAEFAQATKADPKLYRAFLHQAMARVEAGRGVEAEEIARKATQLDPNQPEGWSVLGAALFTKDPKAWKAAIDPAQQGAFLGPHCPYAQYWVGRILESAGSAAEAVAAYKRALEVDPECAKARMALITRQINDSNAAADAIRLAEALPQDAEVQLFSGQVLLKKSDFAGALEPLERAVTIDPKNAEASAALGEAYRGNREYAEAAEKYKQALAIAPENPDYQRLYGITLAASRQCREAAGILEKIAKTQPREAGDIYFTLGWCQFQVARDAKNKNAVLDAMDTAKKAQPLLPAEDKRAVRLIAVINDWLSNTRRFRGTPPPPPVTESCDLAKMVEGARAGADEVRVRHIRSMACAGDGALPYLVADLGDTNLAVKRAAAKTLASLGPSARSACPHLAREIESSQSRMLPSDADRKRSAQEQLRALTLEQEFQQAAQETMTRICRK